MKDGGNNDVAQWMAAFHKPIYAYLFRKCSCKEQAEDLAIRTFTKAWMAAHQLKDETKLRPWLFRIAHREWLDYRRKANAVEARDTCWWESVVDPGGLPSDEIIEGELKNIVLIAVEKLPEAEKEVIHLHYFSGLEISEMAKVLEVGKTTIRYRLFRAFRRLRFSLKQIKGSMADQINEALGNL